MDSLNEDNKCLMEVVDELKEQLKTLQNDVAVKEAEACTLKADLDGERKKREELELSNNTESPNRMESFVKVGVRRFFIQAQWSSVSLLKKKSSPLIWLAVSIIM